MKRRVHVAGIVGQDMDAGFDQLQVPDPAEMMKGGLARAIGAPAGIGRDGGVAGDIDHDPAAALARRSGQGAEQGLGQAEGTEKIGRQSALQILAIRIAQKRQRHGAEVGGIVDQHIEPAERAGDRRGEGIDVGLVSHIAGKAMGAGKAGGDAGQARRIARDEGDRGAGIGELTEQRQAKPRGSPCDGDPQIP